MKGLLLERAGKEGFTDCSMRRRQIRKLLYTNKSNYLWSFSSIFLPPFALYFILVLSAFLYLCPFSLLLLLGHYDVDLNFKWLYLSNPMYNISSHAISLLSLKDNCFFSRNIPYWHETYALVSLNTKFPKVNKSLKTKKLWRINLVTLSFLYYKRLTCLQHKASPSWTTFPFEFDILSNSGLTMF